ncbi:hypothetical protein MKEN_00396200 [Mycena kentingensis (nom. inval.)]|nr:hypothetical protein MKEN_00396200 [Mycena kentingensis (nom. inval.)]
MDFLSAYAHYPAPSPEILARFWAKIGSILGEERGQHASADSKRELKKWTTTHTTGCVQCAVSGQLCTTEPDRASCRACCVQGDQGCERKLRFLFDMTKEEFFSN